MRDGGEGEGVFVCVSGLGRRDWEVKYGHRLLDFNRLCCEFICERSFTYHFTLS